MRMIAARISSAIARSASSLYLLDCSSAFELARDRDGVGMSETVAQAAPMAIRGDPNAEVGSGGGKGAEDMAKVGACNGVVC